MANLNQGKYFPLLFKHNDYKVVHDLISDIENILPFPSFRFLPTLSPVFLQPSPLPASGAEILLLSLALLSISLSLSPRFPH